MVESAGAGCDRCISYHRGYYLQKPEVFRTERIDGSYSDLKQCRTCGTWWEYPAGNHAQIIDEEAARQLIRDFGPTREPSSFGDLED